VKTMRLFAFEVPAGADLLSVPDSWGEPVLTLPAEGLTKKHLISAALATLPDALLPSDERRFIVRAMVRDSCASEWVEADKWLIQRAGPVYISVIFCGSDRPRPVVRQSVAIELGVRSTVSGQLEKQQVEFFVAPLRQAPATAWSRERLRLLPEEAAETKPAPASTGTLMAPTLWTRKALEAVEALSREMLPAHRQR